jgi:hypothetical protein
MIQEIEQLEDLWKAAKGPSAERLRPWGLALLDAARLSAACGLDHQAKQLVARSSSRLPSNSTASAGVALGVSWNREGLPREPSMRREEAQWRRIRSLRASRRPYDGAQHPGKQGLAWGPYNRASAVVEALEAAAGVDPLWVDDVLERERAAGAIDALLGIVNP